MTDVTVNADDLRVVLDIVRAPITTHETWKGNEAADRLRAALIPVCPECGKPLGDPAPCAWEPDPVVVGHLTGVRDLTESSVRDIVRDLHDVGLDVVVRDG